MKRWTTALITMLLGVSCGQGNDSLASGGRRPAEQAGCPSGGANAIIDWVDFVKLRDVTYVAGMHAYGYRIAKDDLGPVFARTRCKLADIVSDPEYGTQDGDAAFLEPGTPVYELEGYDPSFRLAARRDRRWVVYEADTNADAERGRDLLDIDGKVTYIGVNSIKDGRTEIAAIRDDDEVERLVEMVLESPVDQERDPAEDEIDGQRFVAFHLDDGSATTRALFPESRLLSRGIIVPQAFVDAIEEAAQRS